MGERGLMTPFLESNGQSLRQRSEVLQSSRWGKWESTLEGAHFPSPLDLLWSTRGSETQHPEQDSDLLYSRHHYGAHLRASGAPEGRKMRRRKAWRRQVVRPARTRLAHVE